MFVPIYIFRSEEKFLAILGIGPKDPQSAQNDLRAFSPVNIPIL